MFIINNKYKDNKNKDNVFFISRYSYFFKIPNIFLTNSYLCHKDF